MGEAMGEDARGKSGSQRRMVNGDPSRDDIGPASNVRAIHVRVRPLRVDAAKGAPTKTCSVAHRNECGPKEGDGAAPKEEGEKEGREVRGVVVVMVIMVQEHLE